VLFDKIRQKIDRNRSNTQKTHQNQNIFARSTCFVRKRHVLREKRAKQPQTACFARKPYRNAVIGMFCGKTVSKCRDRHVLRENSIEMPWLACFTRSSRLFSSTACFVGCFVEKSVHRTRAFLLPKSLSIYTMSKNDFRLYKKTIFFKNFFLLAFFCYDAYNLHIRSKPTHPAANAWSTSLCNIASRTWARKLSMCGECMSRGHSKSRAEIGSAL